MMKRWGLLAGLVLTSLPFSGGAAAWAQVIGLPELSTQSKECIECHKKADPVVYQQWGESKHYRANVACFECHGAEKTDPDAYDHYGITIAVLVTPRDCARCHSRESGRRLSAWHHAPSGHATSYAAPKPNSNSGDDAPGTC